MASINEKRQSIERVLEEGTQDGASSVTTFSERSLIETNDVNRRPSVVSSLAPSSFGPISHMEDRRQSVAISQSIGGSPHISLSAVRSGSPDVSEECRPSLDLTRSDDAKAGIFALQHHQSRLVATHPFHLKRRLQPAIPTEPNSIENRSDPKQDSQSKGHIILSFAELHRMRMRKLQFKLAHQVAQMHYSGEEPEGWEETLKNYIEAIKDYDYMNLCVERRKDPFLVHSTRLHDKDVLQLALREYGGEDFDNFPFEKCSEQVPESIGGTRKKISEKEHFTKFVKRLGMAAVGGSFLVAPMWLMVIHNTRYTALISTTIFVFVFGVVMASVLESYMDVLSVTAAYAAVLVVFVGTNTAAP
ncbi:hypothetical protein B7463_g10322, partial [Scytalidium lignicola]